MKVQNTMKYNASNSVLIGPIFLNVNHEHFNAIFLIFTIQHKFPELQDQKKSELLRIMYS